MNSTDFIRYIENANSKSWLIFKRAFINVLIFVTSRLQSKIVLDYVLDNFRRVTHIAYAFVTFGCLCFFLEIKKNITFQKCLLYLHLNTTRTSYEFTINGRSHCLFSI